MNRGLRQDKKGSAAIVETERVTGTKMLAVAYEMGLAGAFSAESPIPHEVRLAQEMLAKMVVAKPSSRSAGIVTASCLACASSYRGIYEMRSTIALSWTV